MKLAEPRFDRDLAYGKQGELLVGSYLEWIAGGNGRVEIKRKRRADLELYVETECDKGNTGRYQPSGINVTTADAWAFVVGDTGMAFVLPTALLRRALLHPSARRVEGPRGDCPTRGVLVHIAAILALAEEANRE